MNIELIKTNIGLEGRLHHPNIKGGILRVAAGGGSSKNQEKAVMHRLSRYFEYLDKLTSPIDVRELYEIH